MSAPPREEAAPLTFVWPGKRRTSLVLLGFIGLSLFAHVATFFLFQVVYPQRVTIPPTAPQVAVLNSSIPSHAALLRWIEAEDPALVATPTRAENPGLLDITYRASFAVSRTPPRILPPEPEKTQFPAARSPLVVIQSVIDKPQTSPPPRPRSVGRIRFAGPLGSRELRQAPNLPTGCVAALQPAAFLIGVTDRGAVSYVFIQRSSGDDSADAAVAAELSKAAFAPAEPKITWDLAVAEWGDDNFQKPQDPQSEPPQPK